MKRSRIFSVIAMLVAMGCSDNATRLRAGIERAALHLDAGPDNREELVAYVPVAAPNKPYWLIFFPERRVRADELVARGMARDDAELIFNRLAYVDVGLGRMLVVYQQGERLAFTSYYGDKLVTVDDLIVEKRTGRSEVVLRKQGETLCIVSVK